MPKYSTTWDVDPVLSVIEKLGPDQSLSLKDLSLKLGFLLAVTSTNRVSEVVSHDLRFRRFSPEGVSFQLPFLIKKTKVGQNLKTSFHASFPSNPNLCVEQCLKEYENCTLPFHVVDPAKPNRLLFSHIRPHKPITSETLVRWVKEVLARAGVDTNIFKAHSVQWASATAAHNKGVSLEDILHLAEWSAHSMFRRFYYQPTHNPGPARSLVSTPYEKDTSPL